MTKQTETESDHTESPADALAICGALLSPYEPFDTGFAAVPGRGGSSPVWVVCNRPAGHTDEIVLPDPDPAVEAARQAAVAAAVAAGLTVADENEPPAPLDQSAYHLCTDRDGNVLARLTEEDRQAILRFAFGTPAEPEAVH